MKFTHVSSSVFLVCSALIAGCASSGNVVSENSAGSIASTRNALAASDAKDKVLKDYPDIHWWYKCEPSGTYLKTSGWGKCLASSGSKKRWNSVSVNDVPASVFYAIYKNNKFQQNAGRLRSELPIINNYQAVGIINLNDIQKWNKNGFKPDNAEQWWIYGISPKAAKVWNKHSVSPNNAALWHGVDVPTTVAARWQGFLNSHPTMTKKVLKYAPSWLSLWSSAPSSKDFKSAYLLMAHGVTPDLVKPFLSAGLKISNGKVLLHAYALHNKGVSVKKSVFYAKRHVSFKGIDAYNAMRKKYDYYLHTACHGKIGHLGQLLAASPYSINKGHCYVLPALQISQWTGSRSAFVSSYALHVRFKGVPQSSKTQPMLVVGRGSFTYDTSGNTTKSIPSVSELSRYIK